MNLKTKLTAIIGAALLIFSGATAVNAQLKVGFVYVGPIGDHGWTYEHNAGRLAIEKALGSKVSTSYVEKVPEGADALRVISKLASSGHGLIFTTSFGYMNPTIRAAKRFPKVTSGDPGVASGDLKWIFGDPDSKTEASEPPKSMNPLMKSGIIGFQGVPSIITI